MLKCHHPSSSRSAVPWTHVPAISVRCCLQLPRVLAAALIYFVFSTRPAVIGGWGELMTSLGGGWWGGGVSPSSLTCAPKLLDLMHPQPWQPKDKTGDRTSRDLSANMHTSTCSRADMCSLGVPVITCIQNNNNTKVRRKVRLASSIRNYTRNSIKIDIFYNAPMQ